MIASLISGGAFPQNIGRHAAPCTLQQYTELRLCGTERRLGSTGRPCAPSYGASWSNYLSCISFDGRHSGDVRRRLAAAGGLLMTTSAREHRQANGEFASLPGASAGHGDAA